VKNIAATPHPDTISLYDGDPSAPDHEVWTKAPNCETWVRNVSRSSLTPFLPKAGTGNGAAVLVVPGGGFQFVSISNEGWPIAQWLAELGFAAFVLTYRTEVTPTGADDFDAALKQRFVSLQAAAPPATSMATQATLASEDAQIALRLIRDRAQDWGLAENRVGMLGFSAGAMTTLATVMAGQDGASPDFIGLIYGPMNAVEPPANPPPLFVGLSADDPLFGGRGFGLVESWQRAGGAVELHYYERGEHGFGSHKKGTTSDLWFDQFVAWMTRRGLAG
jgi:acetyl esterase/lipase